MAEARSGSTPRHPPQPPSSPAEPSDSTPPATSGTERGESRQTGAQPGSAGETPRQTPESRSGARSAEAAKPGETGTVPATEKPIYNVPEKQTSFYVVTVDNRTGSATKIERLNEDNGQRKELSASEYASISTYWGVPTSAAAGTDMTTYLSLTNPLVQAYVKGMVDYYTRYVTAQS
jgi:hypothetical protein